MKRLICALALLFVLVALAAAECITIEQAKDKIGSTACVTGKVLKIGHTKSGTTFLDFCDNYKNCPFVVVVFARDLKDVGDVTELEGKVIEITGKIEDYNGRAEIVLKDIKQLHGLAANIPPVPKTFDADKHGKFSAGTKSQSASTRPKASSGSRKGIGIETEVD